RLDAFIAAGGGVIAVLGATGTLPGWIGDAGAPIDRTRDGGGAIGWAEYGHPVLSRFRDPRNGDLAGARYYRYRGVQPADSTRVPARPRAGACAARSRGPWRPPPRGGGRVPWRRGRRPAARARPGGRGAGRGPRRPGWGGRPRPRGPPPRWAGPRAPPRGGGP